MALITFKKPTVYTCHFDNKKYVFTPKAPLEVSDEELAKLRGHPGFRAKEGLDWFEILEDKSLSDVTKNTDDMKLYVSNLNDIKELKNISENDERAAIRKLAKKQLDLLMSSNKDEGNANKDPYENV